MSRAGGNFTLTADANFSASGGTFGIASKYFKSTSSNIAQSGVVRFANNEGIAWRNPANSADMALIVDGTGTLSFNGVQVPNSGSNLSYFSATTSLQLKTLITDETGSGSLVFGTSPVITTPTGIVKGDVGLGSVDNTSDASKPVSTATQTALNLKANIASPTFTGTVAGITATMVGLGNVTNTSDANKPVSTAQQTALDLKANLASPTFTGTVVLPNSQALVTPVLGTPTSVTLTNATGLPVATGISGLGAGVATFLATPSTANLAAAVTGETGSGALVFATSPTLVTPVLGVAAATSVAANAIIFPGTQVSSANVNTLDDYEEGTFTPTLAYDTPGTSSFGYAGTTQGKATKIGNVVTFSLVVVLNAFTKGTASGSWRVAGLPYAASIDSVVSFYCEQQTFTSAPFAIIAGGQTAVTPATLNSNGASSTLSDPDSNSIIIVSGTYLTTT